jgi:hypothetical protein
MNDSEITLPPRHASDLYTALAEALRLGHPEDGLATTIRSGDDGFTVYLANGRTLTVRVEKGNPR